MVQATTGAITTTNRYNGLGQRVSKTAPGSSAVSRRFAYDESGHLIGEYDGAGAPTQETVYLGDLPIAVLSGTSGIHYVHADQINTPREIMDSQGGVVWRWESDPFGVGAPDQDPDGDGVGFVYNARMPGQYWDQETGLYYNYFRDYDPTVGRYVQSDPIGLGGGLNTYLYVNANPLRFVDPEGLLGRCGMPPYYTQNCPPPPPGCEACMKGVAAKYASLPVNDKYKHCMVGAEGAKKCGSICAGIAAIGKEYRDLIDGKPNTNPEIDDARATFDGISCASDPGCGSVKECCKRKGRYP